MSLLDAGVQIVGGLLGFGGQQSTNATNIQIAREQMDFQERMSNTAHQREMADLTKAGLNPLLAATRGGASTPPGASTRVDSAVAAGVSSAAQVKRTMAEVELLEEQAAKTREEERSIRARNFLFKSFEMPALVQEYKNRFEEAVNMAPLMTVSAKAKVDALVNSANEALQRGEYFKANRILAELEQAEGRAKSEFFSGIGKWSPYVSGARQAIGGVTDLIGTSVGLKWALKSMFGGYR